MLIKKEGFEYRTTFTVLPKQFPDHDNLASDLSKISPKPPKGEAWQLVAPLLIPKGPEMLILYYWERPYEPSTTTRQYPSPTQEQWDK